jgi:Ca-activated chloride channel family protein
MSFGMTFAEPRWLWLLALLPLLQFLLLASERARRSIARRFVSERLRGVSLPARVLRPWLLGAALAAVILALAGPRYGVISVPVETREANRVIVLDVSNSMAAEDVGTSRIDAAKAIGSRLIEGFPGRVGLVIFESRAEVVSPLTTDGEAVDALLATIQPGEIGDPGSDVAEGLSAAMRLLEADPGQRGDIVVLSDGEDQGGHAAQAIAKLRGRGVTVHAVVIGSGVGATIPAPDEDMLHDDAGNVVRTYAQTEVLGKIAAATGGTLSVNPFAAHALDALATPLAAGAARKTTVEVPVERYQWPLGAAFFLLMLGSAVNRGAE